MQLAAVTLRARSVLLLLFGCACQVLGLCWLIARELSGRDIAQ